MNTRQILDLYLEQFVSSGRKLNRRDIELKRFVEFCSREYNNEINYITVQKWLDYRSHTLGMQSLATVQNRISDFCQWAWLLDKNFAQIPRAKRVSQDRRPPIIVDSLQVANFMDRQRAIPSRKGINPNTFYAITGLLYTTGLRVGEALELNKTDIDLNNRSIYVPAGKGFADRTVWFSSETQAVLSNYQNWRESFNRKTDRFFIFDKINPKTSYNMYSKNFRKVAIESKMRSSKKGRNRLNFTAHDLRHSYTVNALIEIYNSDLDVHEAVAELSATLGHNSIGETYWYVEAVPALVDAATRRMTR